VVRESATHTHTRFTKTHYISRRERARGRARRAPAGARRHTRAILLETTRTTAQHAARHAAHVHTPAANKTRDPTPRRALCPPRPVRRRRHDKPHTPRDARPACAARHVSPARPLLLSLCLPPHIFWSLWGMCPGRPHPLCVWRRREHIGVSERRRSRSPLPLSRTRTHAHTRESDEGVSDRLLLVGAAMRRFTRTPST